ncbi:hypothetical protein KW794_02985 [Candidatus Saccharibacteria bacterium]|nr:hypothetical protein [Candidatus Saccharibacteria bacterium]
MRRYWIYGLGIILIAAAVTAAVLATNNFKNHDDKLANSSASKTKQTPPAGKNACSIFTLADAKQLLGDTAKGGISPIYTSTTDFDVSTCSYTQDQGANAPVSSKKAATLLMQAPKTETGIASNLKEFGPLKPVGVQDLTGYGDQSYWDPEHGQMSVLKDNVWYILSLGPNTPSNRTLDDAKRLADLIISKM